MDETLETAQPVLRYRLGLGEISVSIGGVVAAALILLLAWFLSRVMRIG
jgi:hypothetical protein